MVKTIYQIEPHNNGRRGNQFKKGITAKDHYGTNPMENTGVPLQGFKGEPVDVGRGRFGVPIPGTGLQAKPVKPAPACAATTKAGEPCKAAPIKNEGVCVGHSRVKSND